MNFWYTDLSQDSGMPWFRIHLDAFALNNGNLKHEISMSVASLKFWRIKLLWALCSLLVLANLAALKDALGGESDDN